MAKDNTPGGVDQPTLTLSKATPSTTLVKPGDQPGVMRVNLNWTTGSKGFFRKSKPIELELGCLYELSNGTKGVIAAIGNNFGALDSEPHIVLDGDDRGDAANACANLHIDLARPELFRRILIFAAGSDGVPDWAAAHGVVTLFPTSGPQIEVRLDAPVRVADSCAVALLQHQGTGITVHREVHYVEGAQRAIDKAYRWGMDWHGAST
ncbi:Tellurium resistance [Nocardia sp. NPDC057440]|uniref:Tellurium resistance n=1 Tax=Nocardia sp. NPDC057440 TaxID=3346134 RepID=UPI00366CF1C5